MRRVTSVSFLCAGALSVVVGVAGCTIPGTVAREEKTGQVTERAFINASQLLTGDCFSPTSSDTDLKSVEIIPCADTHAYVVLDQGQLTALDVLDAGGLHNAVTTECAVPFTAFVGSLAADSVSNQEFLVMPTELDGIVTQSYSCIATMPVKADTDEAGL